MLPASFPGPFLKAKGEVLGMRFARDHKYVEFKLKYGAFSHDVTAAMLVFQNKGMAPMMVY